MVVATFMWKGENQKSVLFKLSYHKESFFMLGMDRRELL